MFIYGRHWRPSGVFIVNFGHNSLSCSVFIVEFKYWFVSRNMLSES